MPARKAAAQALVAIPTDEAFIAALRVPLTDSLLLEMTYRFPRRAVRVLGVAAAKGSWLDLFYRHVLAYPEAVDDVLPGLPTRVAALVDRIRNGAQPDYAHLEDAVPAALREPRWARPPRKRPVVSGLQRPTNVRIVWSAAERQRVLAQPVPSGTVVDSSDLGPVSFEQLWALVPAATTVAGPILHDRPIQFLWDPAPLIALVAAHGVDVHDAVVDVVRQNPAALVAAVEPFQSPRVADLVTHWISEPALHETAATWLRRHPTFAAQMLISAADGRDGAAQQAAGRTLRFLADRGYRDEINAAANGFGVGVHDAIAAVCDEVERPALDLLRVPWWITFDRLTPVTLRDSLHVLPDNALRNLIVMLTLSTRDAPHPDLAEATAACDPDALSDAVRSMYQQWCAAGTRETDRWPLTALATLGNDRALRALRDTEPRHFTEAAEILGCSPDELAELLAAEQPRAPHRLTKNPHNDASPVLPRQL